MEKNATPERDAKGDVKFNAVHSDSQRIRRSRYTYVFHYYDENREFYVPYFGLFSSADEKMEIAKNHPDFYELKLYRTPDQPPYDFFIGYYNRLLAMQVEFFKEVFEERAFVDGYQPEHKYTRIILPKYKHDEIINCINDFGLLPIRDLLFEIIAIAQKKYVSEVAHWENSDNQLLITTAEKETKKVIEVIEKLEIKTGVHDETTAKLPSELQFINFAFSDGSIKIKHNWLAREFIDHFKDYYDNLHFKNWKKDLERYPERFQENVKQQQFKYKLTKSIYNLLTTTGFFKVTETQRTPNRLMICIAKLVEFCLIPVARPEELDEIKIKNIRNWLKRKELHQSLTYTEIEVNKARLGKYFEDEFINITDNIKRADAISIGCFLAQRFDVNHLTEDLVHIADALREYGSHIGHQMIGEGRLFEPSFNEFTDFSRLVNGIIDKKRVTSIKYTMEGDEREYEVTQRLPMYLVEESIRNYVDDHQVEFDSEPVKTSVTRPQPNSFKVQKADHFLRPEQRFMVRFVKSFYDYLLVEAPPLDEWDLFPSERYYSLIANMLQYCWFFQHRRHPEPFIIQKVKQWHQLALES